MSRQTMINATILLTAALVLLAILTACELPAGYEPGDWSRETGQLVIDSADTVNDTLNQSPGLDAVAGDEIRGGVGLYRLAGEALLAFGLLLQTRRRKEAESAILEIDDAKDTPKARDQAMSIQARKTIRKITG